MQQPTCKTVLRALVMVLFSLPALAEVYDGAKNGVHVTDPELLESMGYAPDASHVYATPEAYAMMRMTPEDRAATSALESESEIGREPALKSAFGSAEGVTSIQASGFAPTAVNSSTDYQVGLNGTELWCNAGNTTFMGVFRGVPHGARATVRRIWYYDDHDVQNITVWLERTCMPFFSEGQPTTTILRMNTSTGTPGYGRFGVGTFLEEDIDAKSCSYSLRARLGNGGSCAAASDLRLVKAALSWQRQVSPAPASATFGDVPTSHTFFQFVEALADAGITAGCGGGDFCPNDPVTRGQMAVFLAAALGLHWDDPL